MSESIEQFIDRQLRSGRYVDREELERAAYRALQRREAELDELAEHMRGAADDYKEGKAGEPLSLRAVKAEVAERRSGGFNNAR